MAESLRAATAAALLTANAAEKAAAARDLWRRYQAGAIDIAAEGPALPDRPARPARPELLPPARMPRRGKAGSPRARFALLHALAHIELNAIDLAVDMAGRFGPAMPPAFTADWLRIANEEAQHFLLVEGLLAAAGGAYGDLPAHDGLWEAALITRHDMLARLAIVPQVLEARGLDVTPAMIERFRQMDDAPAVAVLQRILTDEVGHVEAGNRWFRHACAESGCEPLLTFRHLVETWFRGPIKPPFNDSARHQAGLTTDWYSGLGSAVTDFKRTEAR